MSKRDRYLRQRLDELFSSPPAPPGVSPEMPAAEPEAQPARSAALADLSYLKTAIAQLPLPAYVKDREHTWLAVNAAFARIVGHAPEALLGHSDKEQSDEAWQMDDRVLDNGRGEDWQETTTLPDGLIRTRRTRRIPLFGEGREVRYVMGVVEDNVVAAPTQAQPRAATAADEDMFRDLFENTDALIQGVTKDGAFVFTNRAWREALGYSEEELARLNLFDVIHPDSRPHCLALFQRIMEGEHAQQIEAKFVAKDGHTIDVEGSTSGSFKDGRPFVTRGVFHDVSRRKRLEHDLQRLLTIESKRAVQLQTAAEVSKAAGTVLDVNELLPFVVNLIQQRFNLYYVGLFLVDDTRQNAVLRAGTGEAGQLMLNRRHHLPLDDHSMIGWCIQHQMPRIALDVGEDAVHFSNPNLPDTRSELALPLVSRGQVLGAMTVQSNEAAAFSEQDISILQTMTDQVATAIANAQLFEQAHLARQQSEARLRETQFLQSVGQAVSSSLDLSSVLDVVMATLQHELGFTHIALALLDKQAETVSIPRASGTAAGLQGLTRSIDELQNDILLDVLRQGQIEVIDGWDDRFNRQIYESQGHAALVRAFIPLRLRRESIGLLEVGYRRVERARITPEELRLLGGLADQIAIAVGNARLFDETQRRVTELQTLYDLSQVLASRLTVDQVLQEVYRGVSRLLDTSNFYIGLYSPEQNRVSFPLSIAEAHQDQGITEISADQGLTGYIIRTKAPLLIRQGLLRWEEEHGISSVGELAASWLGVPLLVGQQVLGVMAIQVYTGSRLYDEHDRDLLMAIANQAVIALQNARLFERSQQSTRELAALNEFGQAVSQQLDVEQVLEVAYQRLQSLLPIDAFFAALYDHESNTIAFPVIYDEGKRYSESPFPFNPESNTGQVILTGEPILELLTADELAALTEVEGALGNVDRPSASLLYVPLSAGPQTIGTFSLQSYQVNAYTRDTVQLVGNVANQVAIAIQNARLFDEARQRSAELAALNQIISSATQTLELRALLDTVLRQTLDLFGFDGGLITMFNADRQKLERIVRSGLPGQIPSDPAEGLEDSLCAYVFNSKQTLVIEDFREGAPIEVSSEIEAGYYSYIGIPLEARGRMLGTWCGYRKVAGPFAKSTLPVLQAVGSQLGFAIENAQLFEQTQRAARREQTLREITARVRNSTDPDAIARTAVRELGLALGRKTFIRLGDAEQLSRPPQANQEVPAPGPGHDTGQEGGQ